MAGILRRLCLSAAMALAVAGLCVAAPTNLAMTVKSRPAYPGKVPASAVCMRSMIPRPASAKDPYDTLQAIRGFHVTRLEWAYGLTPAFIAKVKALGCTVSGACNTFTLSGVDRKAPEWYRAVSVLDLNGEAVEAPWMRAWPGHALWACANNPVARAGYLEGVKQLVDLGLTDLQRDDPAMNVAALNWGACFCPYCVAGFRDYLRASGDPEKLRAAGVVDLAAFDYAAYLRERQAPVGDAFAAYPQDYLKGEFSRFQEQSVVSFHRWWREELNRYAGRVVPVSANNGVADFSPVYRVFDCFVGELNYDQAQPETLHEAMGRALELGAGLTVTMPLQRQPHETPEWVATIRRTLATTYALGMHMEAPWDTYLPIPGETPARFFGQPADYADLFALARARPELLDGYEEAACTGGALDEGTAGPVTVWADDPRVYAFTRVRPAQPDAPVVVHLLDWSAHSRPFEVSLNPQALFAGRPLSVSLVTAPPYDQSRHEQAFDSRDYAKLDQTVTLAEGAVTTVEVPALSPWGMLVIKPLATKTAVWPPVFVKTQVGAKDAVALQSLATNAVVRYTTDGTAPAATSPRYTGPLLLEGLQRFRARAWQGGKASAVVALSHFPAASDQWRSLLANADFAQGTTAWQKVTMAAVPPDSLEFSVGAWPELRGLTGARLQITNSDGVPYHVRLVQPVTVAAKARLFLRTTLAASRPTRVRLGIQEVATPHRVVGVRVVEIGPRPQTFLLTPTNEHPDLQAQLQLDLGYATPGTTVWMGPVQLRAVGDAETQ